MRRLTSRPAPRGHSANERAIKFYERLKYEVDESSPSRSGDGSDAGCAPHGDMRSHVVPLDICISPACLRARGRRVAFPVRVHWANAFPRTGPLGKRIPPYGSIGQTHFPLRAGTRSCRSASTARLSRRARRWRRGSPRRSRRRRRRRGRRRGRRRRRGRGRRRNKRPRCVLEAAPAERHTHTRTHSRLHIERRRVRPTARLELHLASCGPRHAAPVMRPPSCGPRHTAPDRAAAPTRGLNSGLTCTISASAAAPAVKGPPPPPAS